MHTRTKREVPAQLKTAQRRFERWRGSHAGRRRIPESLWAVAVKTARQCGISRTARALCVDYYRLKKRVASQGNGARSITSARQAMPAFLELTPTMPSNRGRCVVELEDSAGTKMRIQLESLETADLVALSRSFWEA